jgi:hypothetical protein
MFTVLLVAVVPATTMAIAAAHRIATVAVTAVTPRELAQERTT